jgi:aerobic C4-dicarboxylate transport protein
MSGFSILRFIAYFKNELLIVLGTRSSDTVLPHMMQKMELLGAPKSLVGLVVATGYSFNLDGTNIYMTLATLFLAQAINTPLTLSQELCILVIAMIISKGASGLTGAGFVTPAATLAIVTLFCHNRKFVAGALITRSVGRINRHVCFARNILPRLSDNTLLEL